MIFKILSEVNYLKCNFLVDKSIKYGARHTQKTHSLVDLGKHFSNGYHFYICITDSLKLLKASLHTDSVPKLSDIIELMALLRTFYFLVCIEFLLHCGKCMGKCIKLTYKILLPNNMLSN